MQERRMQLRNLESTATTNRYYQDIREIIVCSTVEQANVKLKDPVMELLKVEQKTRFSSDGKEISSEPLFILGRRASSSAKGTHDKTSSTATISDPASGAAVAPALKLEFDSQRVPRDSLPFLSFKARILDKLEKEKRLNYRIVEDESGSIKAVECFGKISEDEKRAIERYGAWVKKVTVPPPD
jgi:hypothetical protein